MQLPQDFTNQMLALLSPAEWTELCAALDLPPQVSLRLNGGKKATASSLVTKHISQDSETAIKAVPWSTSGYYLDKRPNFTLDPLFHTGAYYVQEASSMFVEQALRMCGSPKLVLDLCAAPGGKSTLLRSLLPDDSLLLCNEPVKTRANVLAENIIKWGNEGCFVSCNYPKDIARLGPTFDLILVDAPCSGEGMFRKDNPAVDMWSVDNVAECAARQRDIVETIWPTLHDGGYLIYSTCTYNTQENEQNVRHFCTNLGAQLVEIPTDPQWGITGSLLKGFDYPVYHFLPHKTRGEGFFLALLKKDGTSNPVVANKRTANMSLPREYADKLQSNEMATIEQGNTLYAVNQAHAAVVTRLARTLYPLHLGIALCEQKGRKQVPHHSLAMSRLLRTDAYPTADLTQDEALAYLRHQAIRVSAPRGYVLVCYNGVPLGFVNNLGNRANNLYPAEWRIRH